MIEVFLFGIVLGLIPITLAGLFVTAYLHWCHREICFYILHFESRIWNV